MFYCYVQYVTLVYPWFLMLSGGVISDTIFGGSEELIILQIQWSNISKKQKIVWNWDIVIEILAEQFLS